MRKLMRRLSYALRFRRREAELAEELEFHRERLRRDLEAGGVQPTHAAAATRRELGNVTLAREQARDVWIWPWLQDIAQDVRFAARMLAKDPRFACTIVLALGLGIGATNTVFTLVNTVMLRDLPFERADQLVALGTRNAKGRGGDVSYADYQDWSTSTRTFSGIAAVTHAGGMVLRDDRGAPQRLRGQFISVNTFQVLRRRPIIGRDFAPSDDRPDAPPVVMLGYDVWHGRYGGDPSVIGLTVRINDVPSIIIGVMPEGFAYSFTSQVWQPLSLAPRLDRLKRDERALEVVGRLADGSDREAGRVELEGIAGHLARAYPETNAGVTPTVRTLNERFVPPLLFTLMGAVAFVLLIACANVANLLLARAVVRAREMAVRASLGATRWRLMRQLLIECLLLAALAGVLGLILSVFGVRFLGTGFNSWEGEAPAEANMPYWVDLSMNWVVFLFLSGVCLTSSLLFGLVPAWHVSKTNTNALLKEGGRGAAGSRPAQRLTSLFVVAEIALTLVLLTGAGLLARSFLTIYYTDYAIDTSHLAVMRLALSERKYPTPEARAAVLARLDERLASLSTGEAGAAGAPTGARTSSGAGASSGIMSAVIANDMPFAMGRASRQLAIEGRPPSDGTAPPEVAYVYASDRYFSTVGLRIVRGRPLARGDDAPGREGAVVNERFAATHFPNEDPIGRRIRLSTAKDAQSSAWRTIVGVARNMPRAGSDRLPEPVAYVPLGGEPAPGALASLIVRTIDEHGAEALGTDRASSTRLAAVTARLRDEVRAVDPDLPLYSVETMDAVVARGWSGQRLFGGFLGMLAFIALVLATVGLYAVTAHGVARRTQEIGVRMALGARAGQVVWLFARRALVQLAIGVTLGLAGALAVGRLLQALLVGTAPRDTVTLVFVALLLVAVTSAASYFPARHAARLDPLRALRDE